MIFSSKGNYSLLKIETIFIQTEFQQIGTICRVKSSKQTTRNYLKTPNLLKIYLRNTFKKLKQRLLYLSLRTEILEII